MQFLSPLGQKRRCWAHNLVLAQNQVSVLQYFCFEHMCPHFPFSLLARSKGKTPQRLSPGVGGALLDGGAPGGFLG